jgi:AcrR family transcriptional regulator
MGSAERKERAAQQLRKLILTTAMELFLEEGFENVTIRRIAGKIEYSPATVYLYYRDKNEILYSLHAQGFEMLYEQQKKLLAVRDPWERLRRHGKVYVSFALENPEYYDLMFIMRGPAAKMKEKKDWESGLRSYEFLKENVKQCMEAGYLKKSNEDVATFAFWSLTHGIASLVIRERCIMFPEEHLNEIIDGARNYLMDTIKKNIA